MSLSRTLSSARARTLLLALSALIAAASAVLLGFSGGTAGAVPAGSGGNNGTVKIHEGPGEPSPETKNEPRVCTFHVDAMFLDPGQEVTFVIRVWRPTSSDGKIVLTGAITADGSGGGRAPVEGAYSLPDGHYRLVVDTGEGARIEDKHKVFWVECETSTSTTPPPPSPSCTADCESPTSPPPSPSCTAKCESPTSPPPSPSCTADCESPTSPPPSPSCTAKCE